MKKQIIIEYFWWNHDVKEIPIIHQDTLHEDALERIDEMRKDGYTSGELFTNVDKVEYQGWWSLTTKDL